MFKLKIFILLFLPCLIVKGQEDSIKTNVFVNFDIYSNYIWRGNKFGMGPSVQPNVFYQQKFFKVGVWGAYDASGYCETDLYFNIELPLGLSVGMTDYYYPGSDYFSYDDSTGSHAFEINFNYSFKNISFSANYILNEAPIAGSKGGDKYFQITYSGRKFYMLIGAGDGWHTVDNKFNICNIGIGTKKEIVVTEKFKIPVDGQVILNPDSKNLYVVIGMSF